MPHRWQRWPRTAARSSGVGSITSPVSAGCRNRSRLPMTELAHPTAGPTMAPTAPTGRTMGLARPTAMATTAMATTGLARPTAMATTAPTAPTRTTMVLMRALTTTRRSTLTVRVVSRTAQLAKCGGTARAIPMAHLLGGSRASAAPRAATEFVASRVYLATTGLDGWTDDGAHDSNWQDD